MEKPPFPQWAANEIARLMREAEALRFALALYEGRTPDQAAPHNAMPLAVAPRTDDGRKRPRRSKYEAVFQRYEESGVALSIDEMMTIASEMGHPMDRANMRSQIFAQKQIGRAHPDGENYRWGKPQAEAAPPTEGDAASS